MKRNAKEEEEKDDDDDDDDERKKIMFIYIDICIHIQRDVIVNSILVYGQWCAQIFHCIIHTLTLHSYQIHNGTKKKKKQKKLILKALCQ